MDSKKGKQGGATGSMPQGLRFAQRSPTNSSANPGGPSMAGGGPFAGRLRQGPVPQQLLGRQKATVPQGYPIGPSSRQGMGSRLGDSTNLNDQIQQLPKFRGSFNPSATTNSQVVARPNAPQGGPSAGQRTNRSSGIGVDETNVPVTDRGQAIKSARHQPKALTQMKPNLTGSEYATQPEEISGYSTAGFKNVSQTSRVEPNSYYPGQRIEDQTWRYPPDYQQQYRGGTTGQASNNLYAGDNQIKFQGDLGDDMLPPNTDDDDSPDERREESAAFGRPQGSPRRGHPNKNLMSYQEKLDETPSINQYRQALNPNTSNSFSQQSQKKQNKNFVTFNEISEVELSQSQIQANETQNDRQVDAYLERIPPRITEDQREDEQTDNSDMSGQNAYYLPQQTNEGRRQKNAQETANMMYSLAGPKSKLAGPSRQRQFQTAADMSGYEGDQDQYRGNSRGRFQGGKIESRKKKKATQQLAAARNANKKFKDAYQAQTQNARASQRKGSSTVPMSQIELNLDEHMQTSEHNQSLNKQVQQPQAADSQLEKQQTGISAISGISALSLISGTSGLSAAAAQSSEKQTYQSIQHSLKPQSQIVDIQVQPSSGVPQPRSHGAGLNDISISEAYQTKPQLIEEDGLRIEHESQPISAAVERNPAVAADRRGRASPLPSSAPKAVDLTGISGISGGLPLASQSQPSQLERRDKEWEQRDEAFREMLEKLSPAERNQLEKRSATKIQKWVRGHIARKTARMQKEINFRQMRKLRRMLSVAYGKTRTKLIRQLMHVLKEAGNLHSDQNYQLWKKYQAHCATIIQRYWRGYSLRYLQIEKFNEKAWRHKQSRLLCALVKGYKTRLLLHEDGYHQGISRVTMDIQRVANQDDGKALIIDVNDKLTLKNLMKRRRQKVIELMRIFNKAYHTQGIIVQLLNQKRKLATQDKLKHMGNQTRSSGDSRQMLSGAQGSQKSLKNVSTLLDYNSAARGSKKYKKQQADKQGKSSTDQADQQISEEFRGSFQNKAHKLKGPLGKATGFDSEPNSGSQRRSSSSPVQENAAAEAASSSDEELETHHSGTLWPSQANAKGQNSSKQSTDLSSLWPSAQQPRQVDDAEPADTKAGGGFASFWPSVQQHNMKSQVKKNKKEVVLEEREEENSQDSGDVDWLALPITKPKEAKRQDPEKSFQAEQVALKRTADKPPEVQSKKQPIRSFDDEPVGQHNWNPHPDESKGQINQFGGVGTHQPRDEVLQIDDIPIRTMAADPNNLDALQVNQQRSSNMSDGTTSQGAAKGYDFEKMIDAAMQKFGGAPAALAPDKPDKVQTKSGVGGPADDKSQKREKDEKQVIVDDKKKELLQKRKKYDPRAAIKKSKQQQNTIDQDSLENPPADTSDNRIQPSRNTAEKLVRSTTPATKTLSDVPEDDQLAADGAPNQEQNSSQQLPPQQPRPYLKRKTKAVKVEKGNQYKVEGKSRIDCWQKGDKEANGNYVVYGNRKRKRQSLLKKNQESKTKLGRTNEGSPSPGPRRQPGDRGTGASPAPFRMNQPKLNFNQADGSEPSGPGANDHQQYMMAVDPADNEHPEMTGGPDPYLNQGASMGYPSYSDPHQQYTNSLLPATHLSNHLPVQDLEAQFELLHGPNQEQFKTEAPTGTTAAGLSSMDRAAQRMREKQMAEMRPELNSHEFKYSMIPFSAFNNSQEVNLYKPTSQIPFLFKDSIPALQKSADFQHMNQAPSLFFKCYSDDLYEAILEDYRSHYVAISNQDLDDDEDGDGEGDEYEEA